MTLNLILAILFLLIIWLSLLSLYTWKKSRLLFNRQSALAAKVERQRTELIDPLRLEILKHSRLLQLVENPSPVMEDRVPHQFVAQFGEDLILYDFFKNSGPGYFVEAGAYDGLTFSNTYLLESLGWTGLLVEPHPRIADLCRENRPGSIVEQVALGPDGHKRTVEFTAATDPRGGSPLSFVQASSKHMERCERERCSLEKYSVTMLSLNTLLDSITNTVDFLSLDVEGMELEALRGFDLAKYKPRVILIEFQGDERDMQVERYLKNGGYTSSGVVGCNCFFARNEDSARLNDLIDQLLKG
jgi:FkbM family methyltransferase